VPYRQDPTGQKNTQVSPKRDRQRLLPLAQVSGAVVMLLGLGLTGCMKATDMQAKLCTSAVSEEANAACDGPAKAISLTRPRAELLTRVDVPEKIATPRSDALEKSRQEITNSTPGQAPTLPSDDPPAIQVPPGQEPPVQSMPAPSAGETKADTGKGSAPAADDKASGEARANDAKDAKDAEAKAAKDSETKAAKESEARADTEAKEDKRKRLLSDGRRPSKLSRATSEENKGRKDNSAAFSGPISEAVRIALIDHPLINLADARIRDALSGIGVARSQLYPQLDGRAAIGHGVTGNYADSSTRPYWSDKNAYGAGRGEGSLSGKQLLYDFGATKADVAKNAALYDSEALKLQEQTETVSGQVADIYLKILEQRALLEAASENVVALEKIVKLVDENEKNGNGTVADIKRVRSRLIDSQSAVADARSELQSGSDRFKRLVRAVPGTLHNDLTYSRVIPRVPEEVIRQLPEINPRVRALEASYRAARHEIEAQRANVLPKVSLESDVVAKGNRTLNDKTEIDAKGMVVFRYKFLDGGLHANLMDQLNTRLVQAEMRMRNDRDEVEADIRRQYRILDVARAKAASLKDNVETALKARQLYDEQFRGGKRTLLELLDIQTTYYTARRTEIANTFEEQRAVHAVLASMGRLTSVLLTGRMPGSAAKPTKKAAK